MNAEQQSIILLAEALKESLRLLCLLSRSAIPTHHLETRADMAYKKCVDAKEAMEWAHKLEEAGKWDQVDN